MTATEFWIKLAIPIGGMLVFVAYVLGYHHVQRRDLFSVVDAERELIEAGTLRLDAVRTSSWSDNLAQVVSFSTITIAVILLAVAYVLDADIGPWQRTYWKVILFFVTLSSVAYTVSIQFYNNAISGLADPEWLLGQRVRGTTFQVIGWYGTIVSILMCVVLVDTVLGGLCVALTVPLLIYVYHAKAYIPSPTPRGAPPERLSEDSPAV